MPNVPTTRLIAASAALASCVPAFLVRSTLGVPAMSLSGRYNRYPATPLCSIAWMLRGPSLLVENERITDNCVAQGQAVFSGPQTRPWVTHSPDPTHFFVLAFYPDALHALTGLDLPAYVDRFAMLEEVFAPEWAALTPAVLAAPDDDARVRLLEAFLAPRWQAVRDSAALDRSRLGDWARRLAVQAAAAGWGRGARAVERRVRAWAGLPMRTLQRMGRAERTLLAARSEHEDGTLSWVGLAADNGYSDQAHLARETRALTGLSPTGLARAIRDDESYWMYRIWS